MVLQKTKRERENQTKMYTPHKNKLKGKQSSVINLTDASWAAILCQALCPMPYTHTLPPLIFTTTLEKWVMFSPFQRVLRHREVKGLLQGHTAGEEPRHSESGLCWDDKKLGLTWVSTIQEWGDLLGGEPFGPGGVASQKDHTLSWLSYSGYKRT